METKNKSVDTSIKQKRRGYATPRRIRELRIGTGNTVGGWAIDTNGSFASEADDDGFRIVLNSAEKRITFEGGVSIRNTGVPFSGTGGMVMEHDSGVVSVEVSGDGDGLGSQQVLLRGQGGVYVGIIRSLSGTARIVMAGLPTSGVGLTSGMLWNDAGTLKIA